MKGDASSGGTIVQRDRQLRDLARFHQPVDRAFFQVVQNLVHPPQPLLCRSVGGTLTGKGVR